MGRSALFEVSAEESFYLVIRNHTGLIVVQVHMTGTRNDHQFLVVAREFLEGILREIA